MTATGVADPDPPRRRGRPQEINRNTLHRILWRRVDARGRLRFKGQDMAESLGISTYHFSRIMAEGVEAGRWSVVKKGHHSVKTYQITDPKVWAAS